MEEKQGQHFARVAEYKARFASTTTVTLVQRYSQGQLTKEAQIAVEELLRERGYTTAGKPLSKSR